MTTRLRRGLFLVAFGAISAIAAPAIAAGPEDDGLRLEVETIYRLESEATGVDVTLEIVATNTLKDKRDEFGVTRFYFDEIIFALPSEATDLRARDGDRELEIETTERPIVGISEVTIDLGRRLYSGQPRSIFLDFRLEGGEARSNGDLRVNPAYAWFYLWAFGDPGLASVRVEIASGFEATFLGEPLEASGEEGGFGVYTSGGIAEPDMWLSVVSARNDRALTETVIDVAGTTVTLRSWPDDTEWSNRVAEILEEGIPVLTEMTGLGWAEDVTVIESLEPEINGYGGWFIDDENMIEVGEDLDAHVILHEISHVWFNDGLFEERWITEGLADTYAAAALVGMGEAGWSRDIVIRSSRGNLPLNEWAQPSFENEVDEATEGYGYAASWLVIDTIYGEVGPDAMTEVFEAALGNEIAYRGEGSTETVGASDDWRRFLDLLEERAGSSEALSLFDTWAVTATDEQIFERRFAVRGAYLELVADAGAWALPEELRRTLEEWDFDAATSQISDAARVIAARDALSVATGDLGTEPPSLESRFEAGEDSGILIGELEARRVIAEGLLEARAAVDTERSLFESVGLIGADPEADLGAAVVAFADADLEAARIGSGEVIDLMGAAQETGVVRVSAAVGIVVLFVTVVWWRRRRRRLPPVDPEPVEPVSAL
ncbi:MAG: hypothetical protein OEX04_05175 [Acidimicrobiia bacterium]|nr:hypothetical protein [Acidimicrobiia bacterium]MDH5292850.1 hypothetical protein [Acidimicrobiia bacterium]